MTDKDFSEILHIIKNIAQRTPNGEEFKVRMADLDKIADIVIKERAINGNNEVSHKRRSTDE